MLFEFSAPVMIDKAYLDFVGMTVICRPGIGTKTDPINNHNTLSDSFLSGLGTREDNDTTSTSPRWADINSSNKIGNVLVVSASTQDTTPDDMFKIHKVKFNCSGCPTINVNPSTLPNGRTPAAMRSTSSTRTQSIAPGMPRRRSRASESVRRWRRPGKEEA